MNLRELLEFMIKINILLGKINKEGQIQRHIFNVKTIILGLLFLCSTGIFIWR